MQGIRFLCTMLFLSIFVPDGQAFAPEKYAAESVLAQGTWVKISVTETGMHQISHTTLRQWGFSQPDKVRIYGYGGNILPERLSEDDPDDLPQVPVYRGRNKIMFYAQGTVAWRYKPDRKTFSHTQNTYSSAGYYFLTESDGDEAALPSVAPGETAGGNVYTSFPDYLLHEKEIVSPGKTGRLFMGEDFQYTTSQNFPFRLTDAVLPSKATLTVSFGARIMGGSGQIALSQNGKGLASTSSDQISQNSDATYEFLKLINTTKEMTVDTISNNIRIAFSADGSVTNARLDYIRIVYERQLKLNNGSLQFRIPEFDGTCEISGCSDATQVWDITQPLAPQRIDVQATNGTIRFAPAAPGYHEYIAFNESATYPVPLRVGRTANQNIHGMETPDMIILSPAEYLAQAQRIADLHTSIDSFKVAVLDHEWVFNEFSSGAPDATAYRRVAKMFYDRPEGEHSLKHLLLFGRGSYDNRRITTNGKSQNYPMLLTYQSPAGTDEKSSYTCDDYFALLDNNSGLSLTTDKMRIGIGRFPVKSVAEAKAAVDKLYNYVTEPNFGNWKNNICLVADDENGGIHMTQSDDVERAIRKNDPDVFINKVYIDAYPAVSTSTGRTYPEAKSRLFKLLDEGQLVLNYAGHANPVGWTHEGLLNITDIRSMYLKRWPLFITATCDFSRYDSEEISGGEYLFLNEQGGAIALISTTRVAFISENRKLNIRIGDQLFKRDADGEIQRLGDIVKNAKNDTVLYDDSNKLVYTLLGDPAMRLDYPSHRAKVTAINGIEVGTEELPWMQARGEVTIRGEIQDRKGTRLSDFNGIVQPTVFDAEAEVISNGYGKEGTPTKFFERTTRLFSGMDSIRNGQFEIKFRMPGEIRFADENGMITLYAYDENGREANGSETDFSVGGIADLETEDEEGPEIQYIYLNTESFADGGKVNESPMLFAGFEDPSGINLSDAGIGHQMQVTLDGKTVYTDVSIYYQADLGHAGKGSIAYPLNDLSEGYHTLTLRVWDTENNSSEATIGFSVHKGLKPRIADLYADSNPARTSTNFYLTHDRPDATITVRISVFNPLGVQVWNYEMTGRSDLFSSFPAHWDLTDASGSRVPGGMYLYRATISTDGVHEATQTRRLLVLGQE